MMNLFSPLSRLPLRPLLLALPLGLLLTPGCRKAEIKTYLAPKEVPYTPPGSEMAPAPPSPSSAPQAEAPPPPPPITYTAPADWKQMPPGANNAPFFLCATPQGDVRITISAIGSLGLSDNILVNMWRFTAKLSPLSEEETTNALSPVEIGTEQGRVAEIADSSQDLPTLSLNAFIHRENTSWIFKMQGPPLAVESQKAAFTAFLKTVKF